MREEENYTDKIINDLLSKEYNYVDSIKLIKEKYRLRGFTLIGIKKEKRHISSQISNNSCNIFDVISGVNVSGLCGVVLYAVMDVFIKSNNLIKLLLPITVVIILIVLFIYMINDCNEKVCKYRMCLDVLDEIQEKLEADCLVALNREIVQEELSNIQKSEDTLDSNEALLEESNAEDNTVVYDSKEENIIIDNDNIEGIINAEKDITILTTKELEEAI